ncbi:MAG: rRNA pseudouridine synthase [Candidatus Cloacimonetes bacterium]|nr:rRNA pseudouridine synthase [Candidatus Cloacimonadota bacterium]
MERINKFLASCELGSRRNVEKLVLEGKVTVNGHICTDLATMIDPLNDHVEVNHIVVTQKKQKIFVMLNKPQKYVVTKSDEFQRKTIYDLLPDFAKPLHPIGRLDYDSEGLLLLTNDGNITNKVTHPSFEIEKTYKVIVKGHIGKEDLEKLRTGVQLDDFKTQPAKVFLKKTTVEMSELKITITEGKNRQVRRMFEAIEHEVISLKRIQVGEIKLLKLPIGTWRFLTDKEVLYLVKLPSTPTR